MLQQTGTPDDELIFLHCLPAFHDANTEVAQAVIEKYDGLTTPEMEVTDEVFQSQFGRQFQQAGNRKYSIMAIMAATIGDLSLLPD